MADTRKQAKKRTHAPKAQAPTPVKPDSETISRCMELVDVTALAWVSVLRSRLHEVERMVDRVACMKGHPKYPGASVVLNSVIDYDILIPLYDKIESALQMTDDVLRASVDTEPALQMTAREAAAELGLTGTDAGDFDFRGGEGSGESA